ncbi:hypothetical protein FOA52_007450 [Chlamydomonas sp. UWO 241]|nr:hypothetical protein FOA52_007450 [Chlamydomonas sp. UWO 241]
MAQRSGVVLLALALVMVSLVMASAGRLPDRPRQHLEDTVQKHLARKAKLRAQQGTDVPKQEASRRARSLLAPATIRILPEYQISSLSSALQARLRTATEVAIQTIQQYLQVKVPIGSGGLLVEPTTDTYCIAAKYNKSHFASCSGCTTTAAGDPAGLLTDLVLYITSNESECTGGVLAYALGCKFDTTSNRPLLGEVNVCAIAVGGSFEDLVSTILHEFVHALGFSNTVYRMYVDNSNTELGVANVSAELVPSAGNRGGTYIKTPKVLLAVREQFGCPGLQGAMLEDNGGDGSAGSHWEYELFQGDIMMATASADASFSRLSKVSLALLEDMGWYVAIATPSAVYLDWGFDEGCDLPQKTCSQYAADVGSQQYFCTASTPLYECSANGLTHGPCSVGGSQFSTACGLVTTLQSAGGVERRAACTSEYYTNADNNAVIEAAGSLSTSFEWSIGATARCAGAMLSISDGAGLTINSPYTGLCFEAACTAAGVLTYKIAGATYTCSGAASVIIRPGNLNNDIACPANTAAVCRTLQCGATACDADGGSCFNGACVCHFGWVDATCGTALSANLVPTGATFGESSGSAEKTTNWAVIGGAVGGAGFAAIVVVGILFAYMNRRGTGSGSVVPTDQDGRPLKRLPAVPPIVQSGLASPYLPQAPNRWINNNVQYPPAPAEPRLSP